LNQINDSDLEMLLVSTFRYGLGRMTYMPGFAIEQLKKHEAVLREHNFKQFIEDIDFRNNLNTLGHDCDVKDWMEFRSWCKGKLNGLK